MQLNNPYVNHNPPITRPFSPSTTSYIHLRPQVNQRLNLHGAGQRKQFHPYRKFQTGSTTTFSGYTKISNYHNKNNYREQKQYNNNDNNIIIHSKPLHSKTIPSLMSFDVFQEPRRKNRRKIQHVEQYKQHALLHQYHTNKHDENTNNNNNYKMTVNQQRIPATRLLEKFNDLILSDSMCRYVRPEKVSPNNIQVKISFESGCDCSRMLNFLEQQRIDQTSIFQADFVLFSLCTNDVANLGPNLALQNCRVLIQRVK